MYTGQMDSVSLQSDIAIYRPGSVKRTATSVLSQY